MEGVIESINEYYSANLGFEVMKGMKETALQAKHTGGRPPLGYTLDADRHYIIDPHGADSVRMIFERYASGMSYTEILTELHTAGYLTAEGRPFRMTSLHGILINRKYTGVYIFNRTAAKSIDGTRNHHACKPINEIIEIPGAIPAIIDEQLWEKAQQRLKGRKMTNGRQKAKTTYLLSGLCTCAKCGRTIVGSSQSYNTRVSKERRDRYVYMCTGTRLHGEEKCSLPRWYKDEIEGVVIQILGEQLFTDAVIDDFARRIHEYAAQRRQESATAGKNIEKELQTINKHLRNSLDAVGLLGANTPESIIEEIRTLEETKRDAEARLEHWKNTQQVSYDVSAIRKYLLARRKILCSDDPEAVKTLIQEFVERIEIDDEKATIHLVIKHEDESKSPSDGGYEWWRKRSWDRKVIVRIGMNALPGGS